MTVGGASEDGVGELVSCVVERRVLPYSSFDGGVVGRDGGGSGRSGVGDLESDTSRLSKVVGLDGVSFVAFGLAAERPIRPSFPWLNGFGRRGVGLPRPAFRSSSESEGEASALRLFLIFSGVTCV